MYELGYAHSENTACSVALIGGHLKETFVLWIK